MYRQGFSLIESLISFAIIAVLATLIFSGLGAFRESAALDQALDETLELLREARARTLGSENALSYGVHFTSTSVTLFTGGVWNAGAASNVVVVLPGGVEISSINLSTTTASVVFERLTGESAATGTVTFTTARSGRTATVDIFGSGLFGKQ